MLFRLGQLKPKEERKTYTCDCVEIAKPQSLHSHHKAKFYNVRSQSKDCIGYILKLDSQLRLIKRSEIGLGVEGGGGGQAVSSAH